MSFRHSVIRSGRAHISMLPLLLAMVVPSVMGAEEAGYVKTIKGQAHVERSGNRLPLSLGDAVFENDRVKVSEQGSVGISFKDETLVGLGPGSNFVVNHYAYDPTSRTGKVETSIIKGTLRFVTGLIGKSNPEAIKVHTPTATVGIRGTDFIVEVLDGN